MATIEERVLNVESQLQTFNDRLGTLKWIGGILIALGLTGAGVLAWIQGVVSKQASEIKEGLKQVQDFDLRVKSLTAELSTLEEERRQIRNQIDDDAKELAALNGRVSTVKREQPGTSSNQSQDHVAAHLSTDSSFQTRITTFLHATPTQPYYVKGQTDDIAELFSCVDLFISELKVRPIPLQYEVASPSYDQLQLAYDMVQNRARTQITPAVEPDAAKRAWHTSGWFDQFQEIFQRMRGEHQTAHSLTGSQLDDFDAQFRRQRDMLWGKNP